MKGFLLIAIAIAGTFWSQEAEEEKKSKPAENLNVRVNLAIDRGVEFLKKQQNPDGSFKGHHQNSFPMGNTALALLALVKSNVSPQEPVIERGLNYLRYIPFQKTYSVGVLLMLFHSLKSKKYDSWTRDAVDWLVENVNKNTKTWAYPDGVPDLSNTQYAALGLRAASLSGYKVPPKVWLSLLTGIEQHQKESGGYPYRTGDRLPTGSMTVAGIAISITCQDELKSHSLFKNKKKESEANLRRALDWYEKRYMITGNPEGDQDAWTEDWHYYYLYGLERAAAFSGRETFAGNDWYTEGAEYLLEKQQKNGEWTGSHWWETVPDTCFALLFLRRASITLSPKTVQAIKEGGGNVAAQKRPQESDKKPKAEVQNEVPFIKDWLLLGPFDNRDDKGLSTAFIDEKKCAPRIGMVQAREKWLSYKSDRDEIDLRKGLKDAGYVVAYGFTYIDSPKTQEALLWFGGEDGAKIFFNGEEVLFRHVHSSLKKDGVAVPIKVGEGMNRLLVKVENITYGWWFSVRISDKGGRQIPNLRFTLSSSRR